jgi:hypothetical protein
MDTITTIHDNFVTLGHAHIDWSPNGGMIWLTALLVTLAGFLGATALADLRAR